MSDNTSSAVPTVQMGSFLTLHYRLAGPEGDVVNTFNEGPATLTVGTGSLSPAIESRLIGLPEGSRTTIELAAGEAFGHRSPDQLRRVPLDVLREHGADDHYGVGDVVRFPTPDGSGNFAGVLREYGPEGSGWVLFDFNHPLAGRPVIFEVQIIGVL